MKAIVCEEPGRLSLAERDAPAHGPDDVLIRIRRVGVCGTDYHIFKGDQPYLSYPRLIGHELSGEVVQAPRGSSFEAGDIVAVIPYLHCGECVACRRGRTNCCQKLRVLGVHQDGGMCEYLAVPAGNVVSAEGLTLDQAAMLEFLSIGAHGIRRSELSAGDRVLVAGAGPIGIAAAIFARARGAEVTVIDFNERRLAFCDEQLGIAHSVVAGSDVRERLARLTGGDFYDVVVDATGSPAAMEIGFGWVGHGGKYVLLSIVQAKISFDDPEFHKRETTLLSSRNATREDFATVLEAMKSGQVPSDALASHRAPLDAAAEAIPSWARPELGTIKALIEV